MTSAGTAPAVSLAATGFGALVVINGMEDVGVEALVIGISEPFGK